MVEEIIFIYSLCSDLLNEIGFVDDKQCKMNAAEVMTVALVSAIYFHGNHDMSRKFLKAHGYICNMLGKSRFNRRIHAIDFDLWQFVFSSLSRALQRSSSHFEYVIDSFPVEACHPARSHRCKLFHGKNFIGYCAAKRKYYYGVKAHVIATTSDGPTEILITPASMADITALKIMQIDIVSGSTLYADRAYTDYEFEDLLKESAGIRLVPQRKERMRRQHSGPLDYLQTIKRKRIETTFSQITRFFPRAIVAVTQKGFIMKILLFIVGYIVSIFFRDRALAKSC